MTEEERLNRNKKAKEYRRTKHGLVVKIYGDQLSSSRKRGHDKPKYNLKQLKKWIFNQENFDKLYNDWVASNYNKELTPSCDRLDNYKGYSLYNIRLVTWRDNYLEINKDMSFVYIPKYSIEGHDNYYFTTENKLYNSKTNRIIKQVVKGGYSRGYVIDGKFMSLNKLKPLVNRIKRSENVFDYINQ